MKQAVILAAGLGSRLARHDGDVPKPLRSVGGQPLLRRNLLALTRAGVEEVIIVVGFRGELVKASVLEDPMLTGVNVTFAHNEAYTKANGVSVLAAATHLRGDFLLLMADHVFDDAVFAQMLALTPPEGGAILGIDRKIDAICDLDDATKVRTDGLHIAAIHKQLDDYDAIDIGMFACTPALITALEVAYERNGGDCTLSEGISVLCERRVMLTHDIGDAFWQDVDDDVMLRHAEAHLEAQHDER